MSFWIYCIGFIAQAFFSARIIIQWVMSERAHRTVSPAAFWICSLAGSWLLFLYGWLRDDFSILLGQVLAYYVYMWNLKMKGVKIAAPVRIVLLLTPVAAVAAMVLRGAGFAEALFRNEQIPLPLLLLGSMGQLIFSLRFVYQWYSSVRRGESVLPAGFWLMSLVGSGMIILYALFRLDPVLILGQSVGFAAYVRNLFIGKKHNS